MTDKIFILELQSEELEDGQFKEPERHGELTVNAKDEATAKEFAENQNPGLKVISTKQLKN